MIRLILAKVIVVLLPFLFVMPSSHALDELDSQSVTHGDMVFFPGTFTALLSEDSQSSGVGWHIPGRHYFAGNGWWALVCDADQNLDDDKKGCKLHSTSLLITESKHAVYDSEPVDSQLLHWSPLPNDLEKVQRAEVHRSTLIAVFKPIRSLAKLPLNDGVVTTYVHQGMRQYPSTQRPGKLEARLFLGGDRYADIVPRVQPADLNGIATFELRIGKQRQKLPGYSISSIEIDTGGLPQISRQEYLLWAGDLDGDTNPDLILNHGGGGGIHVAMYLSSLAKEGELVGLAGRFEYFDPSSSGC